MDERIELNREELIDIIMASYWSGIDITKPVFNAYIEKLEELKQSEKIKNVVNGLVDKLFKENKM